MPARSAGQAAGIEAARRLVGFTTTCTRRGLAEPELDALEALFGFTFADDHRGFLRKRLPCGPDWPDWRDPQSSGLIASLTRPVRGVLTDVEHRGFWHPGWGRRPALLADAITLAHEHLAEAPRLAPVHRNGYLPAGAGAAGHPVLAVWGSEIRCAGANLGDYLDHEFTDPVPHDLDGAGCEPPHPGATVPFWRDLLP